MLLSTIITLPGLALASVLASPLQQDAALKKLDNVNYNIVCNRNNLNMNDIQFCIDWMSNRSNGMVTVKVNSAIKMCSSGNVHITARSLNNSGVHSKYRDVASGANDIMVRCGTRGGSGPANGNGDFIIHINKSWVKRSEHGATNNKATIPNVTEPRFGIASSVAKVEPSIATVAKHDDANASFDLACNGNNVNVGDIEVCRDRITQLGFPFIKVPTTGNKTLHLCDFGTCKVTLQALHSNDAAISAIDVAASMNATISTCAGRGGSSAAWANGVLIVHIDPKWVS